VLNAQVFINDGSNGNVTYSTATGPCMTNTSNSLMLFCAINKLIVNPSTINYKLWIVAYGVTTVDTIIGNTISISTSGVAI
jgi:hypothetical protein